jgi:hypothetical protein
LPFATESKKVAHDGSGALMGCWIWNFRSEFQYERRVMSWYATGIEKSGTMEVIVADPQRRGSVSYRIGFSHTHKLIEKSVRLYLRPKVSTSIPHRWWSKERQGYTGPAEYRVRYLNRNPPGTVHQFRGETEKEELFHQDTEQRQCLLSRRSNTFYGEIEEHWSRPWQ